MVDVESRAVMKARKSYTDLVVWQNAINLVPEVYKLVEKLPKAEDFALAAQIGRSAVSVPAAIAEGQARQHKNEFRQYLAIAKGSLAELHNAAHRHRASWLLHKRGFAGSGVEIGPGCPPPARTHGRTNRPSASVAR